MSSSPNLNLDERQWLINIRRGLEEDLDDDYETPVCISKVPKTLMSSSPSCYTPQVLALGPYHSWRPELYEMERYKLSAGKKLQRQLQYGSMFENLVEKLTLIEPKIRASYHTYLNLSGETLSWMMAMDAAFLLEFLQIYAFNEGKKLVEVSSRMSHLLDYTKWKSGHDAILRDVVLLENQIPLFVLRKMLEFQHPSTESADFLLLSMLVGLSKELSPFKKVKFLQEIKVLEFSHLLDFLYHIVVPEMEESSEIIIEVDELAEHSQENQEKEGSASVDYSMYVRQCITQISKLLSKLKPVRILIQLPWKILSKLPGFAILRQFRELLFLSRQDTKENEQKSEGGGSTKAPLVEEITIPSVTELSRSGVRFIPTNGNISTISFDTKTVTLYLPTITLDVNTEIVLKNLVAYEASSNATGSTVLIRYIELMNGIIDTKEDVKVLRENGIILNHLKSDDEVADLWNGMNKSLRLTRVPFIDKVIQDVNRYHDSRWNVRMGKLTKKYVFGSWKFLTLLAAILLLLLTLLQAFCSVYTCPRMFN